MRPAVPVLKNQAHRCSRPQQVSVHRPALLAWPAFLRTDSRLQPLFLRYSLGACFANDQWVTIGCGREDLNWFHSILSMRSSNTPPIAATVAMRAEYKTNNFAASAT